MKNFLIFLIFLLSFSVFGQDRKTVSLLTSVTHKRINIEYKLEKIFRNKFKRYPFDLKIIHKADQEVLSRELSDKSNDAVFWVSHGAFIGNKKLSQSAGVAPVSMILDYNRDNVAPVFQKVHPQIGFLGIIGCNTKQILETYKEENVWSTETESAPVQYISKAKSVAQYALRKAIKKFKKAYKHKRLPERKDEGSFVGYPITITRTLAADVKKSEIRALRVMNNGRFLGIVEKIRPGQTISKTFFIPKIEKFSNNSFKIELNTGESVYKDVDKIHFGEISIRHFNYNWSLFAKPSGEAFGVNKRIFLYKHDHSIIDSEQTYTFLN